MSTVPIEIGHPSVQHWAEPGHADHRSFLRKYVFSTDHKVIGSQFLIMSLTFLLDRGAAGDAHPLAAGLAGQPRSRAVAILGETKAPGGIILPEFYNSLVTMHGTIMIFFAIMPLLVGVFGNCLIPLQIGAADMAFPRLNMASFWTAVPAGLIMMSSFFVTGGAAAAGWTAYAPLSASPELQRGLHGPEALVR